MKGQKITLSISQNEKLSIIKSLKPREHEIVEYLIQRDYPASIARKLKINRAIVGRTVNKLLKAGLIAVSSKDLMFRRAQVFVVSRELADYIKRTDKKVNWDQTLFLPHNLRYKRAILSQNKEIALDISRFSNSKFKYVKTYKPCGGERYVFKMKSQKGEITAVTNQKSIEMFCVDRTEIPAQTMQEATNILSMALSEAYEQFVSAQRACGCIISLGEPVIVGSIHYATKSHDAKVEILARGNGHKDIAGFEVDGSLSQSDPDYAEIETHSEVKATNTDLALRVVGAVSEKVNNLATKDELKEIKVLQVRANNDLFTVNNNVMAAATSGITRDQQFAQVTTMVAKMQEQIYDQVKITAIMVENQNKLIEMFGKVCEHILKER